MLLYDFWRSSAAWRVRTALRVKGIPYQSQVVSLLAGEQRGADFGRVSPQRLVPVLDDGDRHLVQSGAIIEYLDEVYPEPPLLPAAPGDRARVRAIAQAIGCEQHALYNLRVITFLVEGMGLDQAAQRRWVHHWTSQGLAAIEGMLANDPRTGVFCHGDTPTMADLFLAPTVGVARRWELDFAPYPTVVRVDAACRQHPAFIAAAPESQPGAPKPA